MNRLTLGALLATALVVASPARAQVCGDADGDRRVTVTDGVQILRAGAGLTSACTSPVCDVDANGSVSVTDGVNALRDSAGLTATLRCGAEITDVFEMVGATAGVDDKVLDIGLAPIPGAATTLGEPAGRSVVERGRNVSYSIAYEVDPSVSNPSLLVTVSDAVSGQPLDGFFELALPGSAGVAEFQLLTAERNAEVVVEFFTRAGNTVSAASGIDLNVGEIFFCCPEPICVEGANAGADCLNDGECPGGFCTDIVGCSGGPNDDRPCTFNSECAGNLCCPEGPCPP
jgi:hypothetical protein